MPGVDEIRASFARSAALMDAMQKDHALQLGALRVAELCITAFQRGRKLMICGNGGSAGDAQHFVVEYVTRMMYERPGLPAISLAADGALLSACLNDYGAERVFARQVEVLGQPGDVLFGLTTSGRSANIHAALRTARSAGISAIGLTGQGPGAAELAPFCDELLAVPSAATHLIQEGHKALGHAICNVIEARLNPAARAEA